jgi:hypothetical protein
MKSFALLAVAIALSAAPAFADSLTFDNPSDATIGAGGWTVDRAPTAAFNIDSSTFNPNSVLHVGLNGAQAGTDSFSNYQGYAHSTSNQATSISFDLFVDTNAWAGQSVNTGIWGVGVDASNGISAYSIMAYRQGGSAASGAGFYIFDYDGYNDPNGDWMFLGSALSGWNTLNMNLNVGTGVDYSINGTKLNSYVDPATLSFKSVILDSYNSGVNQDFSYDNINSAAVPLPASAGVGFAMLGGLGVVFALRKRLARKAQMA